MAYLNIERLKKEYIGSYSFFISFLLKIHIPQVEAQDILHNVYIEIAEIIKSNNIAIEIKNVRSYINQRLAWRACDFLRTITKKRKLFLDNEDSHLFLEKLTSTSLIEQLEYLCSRRLEIQFAKQCYNELPKRSRDVLYYYKIKGNNAHQVGKMLNLSEVNVRYIFCVSKSQLKDCIKGKRIKYGLSDI